MSKRYSPSLGGGGTDDRRRIRINHQYQLNVRLSRRDPLPDAPYVASKSAVNGLTRELANQWAPLGVRVNAIAPGWFSTEMNSELLEDERSLRWLQRQCPMGRPGLEHELDGVLLFLASDASSYCTGQVIAVTAAGPFAPTAGRRQRRAIRRASEAV